MKTTILTLILLLCSLLLSAQKPDIIPASIAASGESNNRSEKTQKPPGTKKKASDTTARFPQKFLTIIERDQDKPGVPHVNQSISDINSQLEIQIDKQALYRQMVAAGIFKIPPDTEKLLALLRKALLQQQSMLEDVRKQLAGYDPADLSKSAAFNNTLADFANAALELFSADEVLRNYFIMHTDFTESLFQQVVSSVSWRIQQLDQTVMEQNRSSDQTLQLGAWIQTKKGTTPLHLDGFDTNASPGYYEVNRWRWIPSEDQLSQYREMSELAKQNRDNGLEYLRQAFSANVASFVKTFNNIIADARKDLDAEYNSVKAAIADAGVDASFQDVKSAYKALVTTVQPAIEKYGGLLNAGQLKPETVLSDFLRDAAEAYRVASDLKTKLTDLVTKTKALPAALLPNVTLFVKSQEEKIKRVILEAVDANILSQLGESVRLDENALIFTDKVLALSLNDLPGSTVLDLRNAGQREAGDIIAFQLRMYETALKKARILETVSVTMYEVLPHLYGLPSIVFAQPGGDTKLTSKFQMQPSYNFLVKGLWPWPSKYYRKSGLRNKLTDFSYGLHIGAPDFDKDDVPEIGIGFVLSGFHDYFQLGIANNIFKGNWYWFFGIRLPVPSLSLSGGTAQQATRVN